MGRWRAAVNYLSTQPPVSQPWAVATPSNVFLLELLLAISLISIVATVAFKRLKRPGMFIKACGVRARKVQRTMQEIERKTFHLATLLVPIIHQILLWSGDWTNDECVKLCWVITAAGWTADLARVYGPPWARRLFPLKRLLRESEKNRITGGCYLSLGCTLTMAISPPSITLTSILFLVLGDMSAALIGVSFGGETVGLKLGRHGKKSAEGSAAMLVVCFVVGCVVFGGVELREYPVAIGAPTIHIDGTLTGQRQGGRTSRRVPAPGRSLSSVQASGGPPRARRSLPRPAAARTPRCPPPGAIVATLTEVIEPFGLNDNVTIPVFSSIALQFGFSRISSCHVGQGQGVALLKEIFSNFDWLY